MNSFADFSVTTRFVEHRNLDRVTVVRTADSAKRSTELEAQCVAPYIRVGGSPPLPIITSLIIVTN